MKKLILAFILLANCSVFAQKQSPFITDALSKWKGMKSYTIEVAALMPEDKYGFRPVADENSFGFQLIHMANNMYFISSKLIRNIDAPEGIKIIEAKDSKMTKAEIIDYLGKAFDYTEATFKQMTDQTLEEELDYWGGHSTKRKIVFLLNDHQTHHRGQLVVYLRLNNIKPPKYIGW
jgi:uncharacterized damage-inducible protein DinB